MGGSWARPVSTGLEPTGWGAAPSVFYELLSCVTEITDAGDLALHYKAFDALSGVACHGESTQELISKAPAFWSSA